MGTVASVAACVNSQKSSRCQRPVPMNALFSSDKYMQVMLLKTDQELCDLFLSFMQDGSWVDNHQKSRTFGSYDHEDPLKCIRGAFLLPTEHNNRRSPIVKLFNEGSLNFIYSAQCSNDPCQNNVEGSEDIVSVVAHDQRVWGALITMCLPLFLRSPGASLLLGHNTPLGETLLRIKFDELAGRSKMLTDSSRTTDCSGTSVSGGVRVAFNASFQSSLSIGAYSVSNLSTQPHCYGIGEAGIKKSISQSNDSENISLCLRSEEDTYGDQLPCRAEDGLKPSMSAIIAERFIKQNYLAIVPDTNALSTLLKSGTWPSSTATIFEELSTFPISIIGADLGLGKPRFTLCYVNAAYEALSGYNQQYLIGQSYRHLFSAACTEEEQMQRLKWSLEQGRRLKMGVTCSRRGSKYGVIQQFINLLTSIPVYDNQGTHKYTIMMHYDLAREHFDPEKLALIDMLIYLLRDLLV